MGGDSTSERIVAAATEMFCARGFHGVTVRELCKAAGANTAAVNYHFGSKEKLWEHVQAELNRELLEATRDLVVTGAPTRRDLEAYLGALFDRFLTDDRVLRMGMWSAAGNRGPIARSLEMWKPLFVLLHEFVAAGSERDVELALLSVHSLFTQAFLWRAAFVEMLGRDLAEPELAARVRSYLIATSLELLGITES